VAVASAGLYASLHLAPDRQPRQHPNTQFFYRPEALPAAQQTASINEREVMVCNVIVVFETPYSNLVMLISEIIRSITSRHRKYVD